MADKEAKKEKKEKPAPKDKAKGAKEAKAARDPKIAAKKSSKDPKAAKTTKDKAAAKTTKDKAAAKPAKDPKAAKTPKDSKSPKTPKDSKTPQSTKVQKGKTVKIGKKLRGPKKPKKPRNIKKSRELLHKRGRLYAKAIFSGFKRSQRNQYENVALLNIEGAINKEDAKYYVGKKCAYVYKCKNGSYNRHMEKNKIRILWGKVMRTHGNTGSVRAHFSSNLPAYVMSRRVRIMLYPSNI